VADAVKVFLLTISALFPIVDPLAGSPIFLAMTQEYSTATRKALAWRVAVNSLLLMVGSYFVGSHVLNFFGVSLPVVQVSGGLVVASMGWSMLLEKEETYETARKNVQCSDVLHSAFYPLTLPLTVGPGSISVAITLGAKFNAALRIPPADSPCRAHRHGNRRPERLALLRLGRPTGPRSWQNRNDSNRETLVFSPSLHWRSDHVERDQRARLLPALVDRSNQ
jgi:MarC family membrane protein